MKTIFAILVIMPSLTNVACAQTMQIDRPLADKGAQIAKIHCSRCHVVSEKNRFSGISSTPSFMIIVNYLKDWEERFSSFHTRLPHPSIVHFKGEKIDPEKPQLSVPVLLEYDDIRAITEYAKTLKKQ